MKEETGVRIEAGKLTSMLECTICYIQYTEPTMTKCGHTYCKACIEACINRNHECPDCRTHIDISDITRNIQIEKVQRQIEELRTKGKSDPLMNPIPGYVMSPVVGIFQENLKECMGKFDLYCEHLRQEVEKAKRSIEENQNLGEIKAEKGKEVEKKGKEVIDLVLKEYEKHIRDEVPEPKISSIKVSVQVPSKNLRIDNVNLRPYDNIREIKFLIEKQFETQKNPILKWGADIRYMVLNPLPDGSIPDEIKNAIEIFDGIKPIYSLKILPNSKIVVEGTITCESDSPKPCITLKFVTEEKKAYNYFSCNTCSLNWLCECCANYCHKGHDIKEYLKDHVPQWACCYCIKKGCKLPNKNNPMK